MAFLTIFQGFLVVGGMAFVISLVHIPLNELLE